MLSLIAAVMLLGGAAEAAPPPPPRPAGTVRTDLQRHELSAGGWETLQARVDFAAGASFPRHKHPGDEIIYVLAGTIEYEIAGKPIRLKVGDVLFVPSGTVHAARNVGSVPAAELATYVLEKGKPLTEYVK